MTFIHVEVFIATKTLSGIKETFSFEELQRFIQQKFGDTRAGVATHISALCVANAPLNHPTGYNYLWRINLGEYRAFRPGIDQPHPDRRNDRTHPERKDLPP